MDDAYRACARVLHSPSDPLAEFPSAVRNYDRQPGVPNAPATPNTAITPPLPPRYDCGPSHVLFGRRYGEIQTVLEARTSVTRSGPLPDSVDVVLKFRTAS